MICTVLFEAHFMIGCKALCYIEFSDKNGHDNGALDGYDFTFHVLLLHHFFHFFTIMHSAEQYYFVNQALS